MLEQTLKYLGDRSEKQANFVKFLRICSKSGQLTMHTLCSEILMRCIKAP
jgi:hypothetical protein